MNPADDKTGVVDVLLEFLEVAVHNVLYIRKLYSESSYVPKKKYGVMVYQAIHPEVTQYIKDCFKAVSFHAHKNQLKRLFVCFENKDVISERFVIDLLKLRQLDESDIFLVELEESLRNFMLRLHSTGIYLNDVLSDDTTFSIQLETTKISSLEFNDDPSYEIMPKTKVFFKYTETQMDEAIADVRRGLAVATAAKKHNVPRVTLMYKAKGKTLTIRKMGRESYLTKDEEKLLVSWILTMAKVGFPITKDQLLDSVQHLMVELRREN